MGGSVIGSFAGFPTLLIVIFLGQFGFIPEFNFFTPLFCGMIATVLVAIPASILIFVGRLLQAMERKASLNENNGNSGNRDNNTCHQSTTNAGD